MTYVYIEKCGRILRIELGGNPQEDRGLWDAILEQYPDAYDLLEEEDIAEVSDRPDAYGKFEAVTSQEELIEWLEEFEA